MNKHILILIEELIKEHSNYLVTESLTPLGSNTHKGEIKTLKEIKRHIENMNECGGYTNLITCDFKEKTMTFELPEGFHLKSGEYYIEFNK